jgi:hypothetical protein
VYTLACFVPQDKANAVQPVCDAMVRSFHVTQPRR